MKFIMRYSSAGECWAEFAQICIHRIAGVVCIYMHICRASLYSGLGIMQVMWCLVFYIWAGVFLRVCVVFFADKTFVQ